MKRTILFLVMAYASSCLASQSIETKKKHVESEGLSEEILSEVRAEAKEEGKQEIVSDCQRKRHFKFKFLTFSCDQLFVVE